MDPQKTWNECKSYLQESIPPSLFDTFIRPLDLDAKSAESGLKLHSPADPKALRHIEGRYLPIIQAFLQKNGYQGPVRLSKKSPSHGFKEPQTTHLAPEPDLHLSHPYQRTCQRTTFLPQQRQGGTYASPQSPQVAQKSPPTFYPARINSAFVDSLLEGKHGAILLSVTGGAGSGKTHLGRLLVYKAQKRGVPARYLSLETFLSEFSLACKKRSTVAWRQELRSNQLIVIDDFHFLKPSALKSSEELQNLIDDFQESKHSLVILSQKSLSSLQLTDSLGSRLRCLAELALEYPESKNRLKILKAALAEKEIELCEPLCQFLSERISRDMRLLKSVADRLMTWKLSTLSGGFSFSLDQKRLEEIVGDLFPKKQNVDPKQVLELVAEFYRLPVSEITGPARNKGPSLARHLVAWICTEDLGMAQKEAAALIGRSDHGSVIHARKKIADLLQNDLFFAGQLSQIRRRLFET